MIPLSEARRFVLEHCRAIAPRRIPVEEAVGCVLAEAPIAPQDVPGFDNSAMDGYALRARDTVDVPTRLRVLGAVMAGQSSPCDVGPGEAMRIMTGAPLPAGADAVCMIERVQLEGEAVVVIGESLAEGTNVRRRGEDTAVGDEVFAPSTVLGPPHVGVLKSLGIETVCAHPHPRVGVVSTGDELAEGPELAPGKIRDSNRPALLAQLRREGWEAVDLGAVGDDGSGLLEVLWRAQASCDAVVTSGGVSVGDREVVRVILGKACGETMRWMQVAVKPAKPFAFGTLREGGTPVFGLPGNPVSALVSYELFARPALRAMAGHRRLDRPLLSAVCEGDLLRRRDGKLHLLRVVVGAASDGTLRVCPLGGQDSHLLRVMAAANALALVPDGEGVRAGERVQLLLLEADGLIGSQVSEIFDTGLP